MVNNSYDINAHIQYNCVNSEKYCIFAPDLLRKRDIVTLFYSQKHN